jgi:hypothetical protein
MKSSIFKAIAHIICALISRLQQASAKGAGFAILVLLAMIAPSTAADPPITAEAQDITSDYSWGYKSGVKEHLGSYKNGRSVHAISRRAGTTGELGNPDSLVSFDEQTREALAIEHPAGVYELGVNPGGSAVFTSSAAGGEQGRLWWALGGRAHEIPIDLARSRGLFDPRDFDVVLDDIDTAYRSSTPRLSVVQQNGLLIYRYLSSVDPEGEVRFQRYDLESEQPVLKAQKALGIASFVDGLGNITIEQIWSRWDPRRAALAVTWHWFDRARIDNQQAKLFGSGPFVYTQDLGETWQFADGSPATLPLTYETLNPTISPYDHLALGETMGWVSRDVGFGPAGTPWMTMPADNRLGSLSKMRFFLWNETGWENRVLTVDLDRGNPLACGVTRDYIVCAYSERGTPGTLLVRVSRDEGRSWSTPVAVDSIGITPEGSAQRINWVSFAQPADRYLDNAARFFVSYYDTSQSEGMNYKNNIRWVRLQVGPRADFNGDERVDDSDRQAFEAAFGEGDWRADFNDDGVVDGADSSAFLAAWNEELEPARPAAPSDLVATAISSSRVVLTWQDNSTNETAFGIQRKIGP